MSKHVAVVLPAYNEALGLERLLWRIARALDDLEYEILVVDDGSTDETADIAESVAGRIPVRVLRHPVNSGYGAGIRTGLLEGRKSADAVVTMDADDSHDPSMIPLMLQGIACGSDVIVASRFVPGGREIGVPFHRRVLSHGAAFVFGRLLDIDGIHDYTSGYRAYRSDFLDELVSLLGEDELVRETGFTVGVELLLKSDRAGGTLAEMPLVLRYDRKQSESKLRLRKTMADYARLLRRVSEERSLAEAVAGAAAAGAGAARTERRARFAATMAADLLAVLFAFAGAGLLFGGLGRGVVGPVLPGPEPSLATFGILAGLFAAAVGFAFWRSGLYAAGLSLPTLGHLKRVFESLAVACALYFTILFVIGSGTPRVHAVAPAALAFGVVLMTRRLMAARASERTASPEDAAHRVLIYGAGEAGRLVAKQVVAAPMFRGTVVGFLDDDLRADTVVAGGDSRIPPAGAGSRVLGGLGDLARVAEETGATELYVALPDLGGPDLEAIRVEAERARLRLSIVPRIGNSLPGRLESDFLGSVPVYRVRPMAPSRVYEAAKRGMDLAIVMLVTPIALPVALVTAAAVALDGRPVLFRQTRIGKHGRPFTVWKFRTMDRRCDPYAVSPRTESDPRITRIGRLVRMAGIDELPQLINVVRGEMSLVGPRPEMPQIAAEYDEVARQRLCVRPGITGTWQLSADRAGAIHDSLEHDLYYLSQQNLFFDLLIVVETALFALRAAGRSFAASAGDLARGWRAPATTPSVAESSDAFVLVALDQRRRPDEPASWSAYIPRAASLARDCPVKLVVADMNVGRIRELSSGGHHLTGADRHADSSAPPDIEYVEYESPDNLHDLAGSASVVVTDLGFVADRASQRGIAVVEVVDGEFRFRRRRETSGPHLHAERVRDVFAGADGLRYAQ